MSQSLLDALGPLLFPKTFYSTNTIKYNNPHLSLPSNVT